MNKHDDDKKQEALGLLSEGFRAKEVSEKLGIPLSTIYRWKASVMNPEISEDLEAKLLAKLEAQVLAKLEGRIVDKLSKTLNQGSSRQIQEDLEGLTEMVQGLKGWARDNFVKLEK